MFLKKSNYIFGSTNGNSVSPREKEARTPKGTLALTSVSLSKMPLESGVAWANPVTEIGVMSSLSRRIIRERAELFPSNIGSS